MKKKTKKKERRKMMMKKEEMKAMRTRESMNWKLCCKSFLDILLL